MKKVLLLVLGMLAIHKCGMSQNKKEIQVVIEARNDTVFPLSILRIQIRIINPSSKKKELNLPLLQSISLGASGYLEFKSINSDVWKVMENPGTYFTHEKLEIPRRDSLLFELAHIPALYKQMYFSKPGTYELRFKYAPYFQKGLRHTIIYSNVIQIQVYEYRGEDKKAFDWLKTLELPYFMLFSARNKNWRGDNTFISWRHTIDEAEYLISNFPDSRFTPWTKLFLAGFYNLGYHSEKDDRSPNFSKAIELVQEVLEENEYDLLIQDRANRLLYAIQYQHEVESRRKRKP